MSINWTKLRETCVNWHPLGISLASTIKLGANDQTRTGVNGVALRGTSRCTTFAWHRRRELNSSSGASKTPVLPLNDSGKNGWEGQQRSVNLWFQRPTLCLLSYFPKMAVGAGLEPAVTFVVRLTAECLANSAHPTTTWSRRRELNPRNPP